MHKWVMVTMLLTTVNAWSAEGWSHYGGDAGGQRHSSAHQITSTNVDDLVRDVGYKPATSVETGIRRFVDWYLAYYNKT